MNNDRIYYSHDAELRAMRESTKLALICLMFGLSTGAALAILFAPSSGKKMLNDLSKTVSEGLDTGRETVEPVVKRLEKELNDLRKNVEERVGSLT